MHLNTDRPLIYQYVRRWIEQGADDGCTLTDTRYGAQATLVAGEERQEADEAIATMLEGIERRERPDMHCRGR